MIIGLTGSMGSGKGEVVRILQSMGFSYITLSSLVREEARKLGLEETRENLMKTGNDMRKKDGAGVLAKRASEKIVEECSKGEEKNYVIDGIRNPAEIAELRSAQNLGEKVYIIGIYTDRDLLIKRILSRSRVGDEKTLAEITKKIDRELGKGEPPDGQQVAKCMQKADVVIKNDRTLEELKQNFISYYNSLKND